MKKLLISLVLLLPLAAAAQTSTQSGARASVGIDWKIRKGLHLMVEVSDPKPGGYSAGDEIWLKWSMVMRNSGSLQNSEHDHPA